MKPFLRQPNILCANENYSIEENDIIDPSILYKITFNELFVKVQNDVNQ